MNTHYQTSLRRQRGMTLVIGLIMLVMISLGAVASYHMSKTSMEVIGNMQFHNEAVAATDQALQEAMTTGRFHETPNNAFRTPCNNVNNTLCFDFNGDNNDDVTVTLQTPSCVKVRVKPNSELNLEEFFPVGHAQAGLPLDGGCATESVLSGIEAATTGQSLCTDTIWNLTMVAADPTTNANVTVTQGVSVTIKTTDADTFCI